MKKLAILFCKAIGFFIPKSRKGTKKTSPANQHLMRNDVFLPLAVSYLDTKDSVKIPLKGYSMRPFLESERDYAELIKPHDPILHEPVLVETDYINPHTKQQEKRWILHRIIGIDGEKLTLQGDGNLSPEYCKVSDIRASIRGFYRKGRKEIDLVSGRKWKVYSFFWVRLRPIRRYLLFLHKNIFL